MATLSMLDSLTRGIRLGDRGPIVADIRNKLNARGYAATYSVANPLVFDTGLDQLVRKFQQQQRLKEDGIVGLNTWKALGGAPPNAVPGPGPATDQNPADSNEPEASGGLSLMAIAGGLGIAGLVWWANKKSRQLADVAEEAFEGFGAQPPEVRKARAKANREAKKAAEEKALFDQARAIAKSRENDPAFVSRMAEEAAEIRKLVAKGFTPGEAKLRVMRAVIDAETSAFGPKDIGARSAAVVTTRLRAGAQRYDPSKSDDSLVIEETMSPDERRRVQNRIEEERRRVYERLLRTGLGPTSEPGLPAAKVAASVRRRPSDIYAQRSITEQRAAARGLNPYQRERSIEEEEEAEPLTRGEMTTDRALRLAREAGGELAPSGTIVLDVDAARYETTSPSYDKQYRIQQNDRAIAIARDAGRPVQLRTLQTLSPVRAGLPRRDAEYWPSATVRAKDDKGSFPSIDNMQRTRPSSVVTSAGRGDEGSHRVLFSWDPRKSKPKMGSFGRASGRAPKGRRSFRDVETDRRIDSPALLAENGDCRKAVSALFKVRGLVRSEKEHAHYRRVTRIVDNRCRDDASVAQLVNFVEQAGEDMPGMDVDPAALLAPDSGVTLARRERSGAEKRKKLKPLSPEDNVWLERLPSKGLGPVLDRGARAEALRAERKRASKAERDIEKLAVRVLTAERIRPEDKGGGRIEAKEIVIPVDGDPYYVKFVTAGKDRAGNERPKKKRTVRISTEDLAKLPPPIAVINRKDGSRLLRFAGW